MTCLRRHLDRKETNRAHLPLSPHTSNPRSLFRARERAWEGWNRETPPNPRLLFHLTHLAPPHNKPRNLKPQSTSAGGKAGGESTANQASEKDSEKRKKHLVSLHAGGAKRTDCGGGEAKKIKIAGHGCKEDQQRNIQQIFRRCYQYQGGLEQAARRAQSGGGPTPQTPRPLAPASPTLTCPLSPARNRALSKRALREPYRSIYRNISDTDLTALSLKH
jgi:hypothetical protein